MPSLQHELPATTELLTGSIPTKPLLSPPESGEKLGSTICTVALLQCGISEVFISIKYKQQMYSLPLYLSSNQQTGIVC